MSDSLGQGPLEAEKRFSADDVANLQEEWANIETNTQFITDMANMIQDIRRDVTMSGVEKRQLMDTYYGLAIDAAKTTNEELKLFDKRHLQKQ